MKITHHYADFTVFYSFSMARILKQPLPRNLYLSSSEGKSYSIDGSSWIMLNACAVVISHKKAPSAECVHSMDCCCRSHSKLFKFLHSCK